MAPDELRSRLAAHLAAARNTPRDSPMYSLLDSLLPPDLARLRTDLFLERSRITEDMKMRLSVARGEGKEAVRVLGAEILNQHSRDSELMVAMLLSYRAVSDWRAMIDLAESFDVELRSSVLVQEQLGLAWNRLGD